MSDVIQTYKESPVSAYAELLRDLAHAEPNCGYFGDGSNMHLTTAQAATVLRKYPDLFAEAMAGSEEVIAGLLTAMATADRFDLICAGIAAEVANRVKTRAAKWILSDVYEACEAAAEARRQDKEFA